MESKDYAQIEAITQRIHAKRHTGWNCEDMHPLVHNSHLAGFRKAALQIVANRARKLDQAA